MDIMTCYIFLLFAALCLGFIAVACVVIDTALAIKKYINERKWIENINNNGGGFNDDEN